MGFDGFDEWVLIKLMEAGLMMVVVWVDDGGLGIDSRWWLGLEYFIE